MRRVVVVLAAVLLLAGCKCRDEGCFGDGDFNGPDPTPAATTGDAT